MINIFRQIRSKVISEHKFTRYLLYAIGEIVLVVVGILIALQINNWNTGRVDRQSEKKSYQNIRYQIIEDRKELTEVKGFNKYFSGQYEIANQIIASGNRKMVDTLAFITMGLSQYSDFHRSGNIYETLVNSGQLNLLKNTDITNGLQRLEMTYNHVNKLEDIHWEIIINELSPELRGAINYSNLKVVQPEKLYSVELQNIFVESIFLTKGKDSVYTRALTEIKTIIDLIDEELNERSRKH